MARAASHPEKEVTPLLVAPSTSGEVNTVRPVLIPKACFNIEDSHFEFDSSFVLPLGLTFDAGPLKTLMDKHPGSKASIFGHTDPVGKDVYNKVLSGRRAQAIFGLLVRDVDLWADLYFHHDTQGKDPWGVRSIQVMLNRVGPTKTGSVNGVLDAATRQALKDFEEGNGLPARGFDQKQEVDPGTFAALAKLYMDAICTDDDGQPFQLTPDDFLARGKGKDGKGDFQGCGEFNPLMMFSRDEKAFFEQGQNKSARNKENQINRRIMILLYRPGIHVDPEKWPCPSVKEGVEKCQLRFFVDAKERRSNLDKRREHKNEKSDPDMVGTFACRFYDRQTNDSPCENVLATVQLRLYDPYGKFMANAPCQITIGNRKPYSDKTNGKGILVLRDAEIPNSCHIDWGYDPKAGGAQAGLIFSMDFFLNINEQTEQDEARKKLNNLGYVDDELPVNVEWFQRDYGHLVEGGLKPTGDLDPQTMQLLRQVHGNCEDDLRRRERT